jgi:predicted secreted protein
MKMSKKKISFLKVILIFIVLILTLFGFVSANRSSIETMRVTTATNVMEWENTFGGSANEISWSVVQTTDKRFALAGETSSYGAGGQDMWLVRTDSNGQQQWTKTFGGSANDGANSMIQTTDGGFVLVGWTNSYGAGGEDCWLVKTSANGEHEWNKTFGGIADDGARSIIQTADAGFVLAGWTSSYGAGLSDFWLVKTSANGEHEWNKTFGGTAHDGASSMIQTVDGGFAILGGSFSFGPGGNDFWLIKTDPNGQHEWNKTYGGPADDIHSGGALIQTTDGGFALAGPTSSYGLEGGAFGLNFWLIKTDGNGQQQWNNTYGGTEDDWPWSVAQTADEGFALAGSTESYGAGDADMWLVRTDVNGQAEWNKTFGGTDGDGINSMIQTADGSFALAGLTKSFGAGGFDMWLIRTEEAGDSTVNFSGFEYISLFLGVLTLFLFRKSRKR